MTPEERKELIRRLEAGEELSPEWARTIFPPEKREYELVYHGKEREEDILADTLDVPLQAIRTFGKNGGGEWNNMLIFGDNLQVMKSLLEMKKAGKLCNADGTPGVRLVYIDPPFATKREFKGSQDQKAYQDRVAGAQFVDFLRRRLVFLKELLADDGNLVIHLDNRKLHYLKVISDEIFGEQNFINEVIWHKGREGGSSRSHAEGSAIPTEYQNLLIYAKNRRQRFWRLALGPFKKSTVSRIKNDKDGWYYTRGRMGRQPAEWELKSGASLKTYVSHETNKSKEDVIAEITAASAQFVAIGDVWNATIAPLTSYTDYPTEKPEKLLSLLINSGTQAGDIVLDAFSGSGTTAAVAEKLGRRWVAIDCGKLATYTMQKRLLNLRKGIGNKGPKLECKPFTLYNAGLYDFSTLKTLPWTDWRFFALQLFGCKDEPHTIGGLKLDGTLKGARVLVFNHHENAGKRIDEETVQDIHAAVGKKIGRKFFIIAPRGVFDFQQDYIDLDGVRYYALRIPYSIINELHHRDFTALRQPNDETAVNETVDAVGFDFIRPPRVDWSVGVKKRRGQLLEEAFLKVKKFQSYARLRGEETHGGLESFSMLMLDFDYDDKVFDLDAVFYAHQLEEAVWEAWFSVESLGEQVMAVFIDIHGNEAREVIAREKFGLSAGKAAKKSRKAVKV